MIEDHPAAAQRSRAPERTQAEGPSPMGPPIADRTAGSWVSTRPGARSLDGGVVLGQSGREDMATIRPGHIVQIAVLGGPQRCLDGIQARTADWAGWQARVE